MSQLSNLSTSTGVLPESWVEKLFDRMLFDYGKKFTDQWGGADARQLKAHWAEQLGGYTGAEIKRGVDGLGTRDWAPTLPEFKKLCRPPINEMVAYYEALAGLEARSKGEMGQWSHPAVFWAASFLRADLLSQTHAQVREKWASVLKAQMERAEWAAIPVARVSLPAPDVSPAAKEHAEKMMRDLEAAGIAKREASKIDHKRWARLIIDRIDRGDKTLSMIQINFATEALLAVA